LTKKKPDTLLRTSERGDFINCQWYWQQHWHLGWSPRRAPTWSWFGIAIHRALEVRYPVGTKRGSYLDVISAFEEALGDQVRRMPANSQPDDEEMVEATELGRAMLKGYIDHYGRDKHWQVLHTEQPFQIDVFDAKDRLLVVYCGTWDLLIYDLVDKVYRLVDHKTAKQFGGWEWLTINTQAGSYLWVAPEVLKAKGIFTGKEKIDGIIFNYLKKAMPDSRPVNAAGEAVNKDGSVSKVQPAPRFHREQTWRAPVERVNQYKHVVRESVQINLVRKGKVEPTKHVTKDCVRCPLFDPCQLHEQGDDWRHMMESLYIKRDGYADHREAMQDHDGIHLSRGTVK
jgi:hypothetical protein